VGKLPQVCHMLEGVRELVLSLFEATDSQPEEISLVPVELEGTRGVNRAVKIVYVARERRSL
jgi:hypothetical protein